MLSYKIINLYIEWYLHYTLDYYINYEYNIYTKLVFISLPCPPPQDKFQVMSLLQFYSHKLSFLMITLKIFIESLLTIWMLVWIFFFFLLILPHPPRLEILGLSLELSISNFGGYHLSLGVSKYTHDHEYDKKFGSYGLRLNKFVSYLIWYD